MLFRSFQHAGPPPAGYAAAAATKQPSATPEHTSFTSSISNRFSSGFRSATVPLRNNTVVTGARNLNSNTLFSAPTSPQKNQPDPVVHPQQQSMVSHVSGLTRNLFAAATGHKPYDRSRHRCLLVIDADLVDW